MLEQISELLDEVLQAPPEIVLPAAIFLVLVLIRLALALPERPRAVAYDGREAEARRWIDDRIDEHVGVLAEAYGEAGLRAAQDEPPQSFDMTVESFIAQVLERELDADGFDIDLRAAVREFIVLHRAELYEDVTTRARKHLAAA